MKIDLKKLDEGLAKLVGYDLEQAESAERAAGNTFVDVTLTKSFQARLAAQALGVNVHDLKELPIKEYQAACARVFNFLFTPSDATP